MSILSPNQQKILSLVSEDKQITDNFCLSGGTALAEFYLGHRFSEDLDFFSENEFDPQAITAFFASIKKSGDIKTITLEQSFNRNLFFLELNDNESIKTEFTYYPFSSIEPGKKLGQLKIDSLLDIAVNKIFTIYQKPRSRDFIDLYCILDQKKEWSVSDLVKKAQIKFDHHIAPLPLSAQFIKSEILKDYPRMIENLPEKSWHDFFISQAKFLSQSQLGK